MRHLVEVHNVFILKQFTDTASVDPSRAGYATGVAQPGPAESVSVEKRPSMLAYLQRPFNGL